MRTLPTAARIDREQASGSAAIGERQREGAERLAGLALIGLAVALLAEKLVSCRA
jgi:hypothetical protein